MVAMTAPGVSRLRPARDPARPVGAWVPVLLVVAGVLLSLLGWATGQRLDATLEAAQRTSTSAAVSEREATLADGRLERAQDQRDGLRALIVQRCDVGVIRDAQVCDAARAIQPAR